MNHTIRTLVFVGLRDLKYQHTVNSFWTRNFYSCLVSPSTIRQIKWMAV